MGQSVSRAAGKGWGPREAAAPWQGACRQAVKTPQAVAQDKTAAKGGAGWGGDVTDPMQDPPTHHPPVMVISWPGLASHRKLEQMPCKTKRCAVGVGPFPSQHPAILLRPPPQLFPLANLGVQGPTQTTKHTNHIV